MSKCSDVVFAHWTFSQMGCCFKVWLVSSLLCCFLRQETLLHIVSLLPGGYIHCMGTGDILLEVTPRWASIPSGVGRGQHLHLVGSCYRNQTHLQLCELSRLKYDFTCLTMYSITENSSIVCDGLTYGKKVTFLVILRFFLTLQKSTIPNSNLIWIVSTIRILC